MAILSLKKIDFVFSLICVGFVIGYSIISFLDFLENKDICEISFKTFHSQQSYRYPSFTMCLTSPFVAEKFSNFSSPLDPVYYYDLYLRGIVNGSVSLENTAYEDVSITEPDFITSANVRYKDEERSEINITKVQTHSWNMKILFMKCFTFDIPYMENALADALRISFNNSIFPNGIRPNDGYSNGGIQIFEHFPKQFGRSYSSHRRFWNNRSSNKGYYMRFYMKGMEVVEKRHKRYEECVDDTDFDDAMARHMMNTLRCRPPYMNSNWGNFNVCTEQKKLYEAGGLFFKGFYGNSNLTEPCSEIRQLDISYEETDSDEPADDQISLKFYFVAKGYKEIRQVAAYGLMSLFGNVGGFVGLLLGYAMVHLPGSIHATLKYLRREIVAVKNEK